MERIKIVYIDDKPDIDLDEFFDNFCMDGDYEFFYELIEFNPSDGYEALLNNLEIQTANIIFIDSWLFENRTATSGKFNGEEFKMVLQKFFPYIYVIVITQNEKDQEIDMIEKYDLGNRSKTAQEYYSEEIPKHIKEGINYIKQLRTIATKIAHNESWEKLLKERVLDTLSGKNSYDSLTKKDIDELVNNFKIIQERINNGL